MMGPGVFRLLNPAGTRKMNAPRLRKRLKAPRVVI
jgi:hypothetical protein